MVNFKRNDVRRTILAITNNIPPNPDPEAVVVVCSRLPPLHRTATDVILHLTRFLGLGLESGDEHVRGEPHSLALLLSYIVLHFFIFLRCVFIGWLGLLVFVTIRGSMGRRGVKERGRQKVHRG